jgi:Domain of Unknown Function (DUF928)
MSHFWKVNKFYDKITTVFVVAVASLILISYSTKVSAQPTQLSTQSLGNNIVIRFQQREQDGASNGRPSGRKGTGSRSNSCPVMKTPITALIPFNSLGLTVDKSPTLWFFIPYQPGQISSGEFSLQDEENNDVYRTPLTLPEKPGIVSFTIPREVSLEPNKEYKWFLKMYCRDAANPKFTKLSDFVYGLVKWVSLTPALENRLKNATVPRERISLYAENGIWYSALTDLAKLRLAQPNNPILNQDWANLLQDVGLEDLANEPIIGKVTPFPLEN